MAGKGVRGETGKVSPRDFSGMGKEAASSPPPVWWFVCVKPFLSCCDLFEFLAGSVLRDRWFQGGEDDAGRLLDDFQALGQQ